MPAETVEALKRRAAKNGRSAEAEHRALLEAQLKPASADDFWEKAARWREELKGRIHGNSADLIREDRDSR